MPVCLRRVSRNLETAPSRACRNDIQENCAVADEFGQSVMEKRASLSQPCETVISALTQAGLAVLRGQPVLSSDGKELGQTVEVNRI
jgi:hypothetical protein